MQNKIKHNPKDPIGIFDSGVGGTSIWKEIHQKLPLENSIYLADSKNAPYGTKTKKEIIALCVKNTEILIEKNCKIIVVACNTATTNAIDFLRRNYNLPFIGIEPAIKPASLHSKNGRIGLLATKGTLSSDLFHKTAASFLKEVQLVQQDGSGIVELIESGKLYSNEMSELLEGYCQIFIDEKVDHLVLGCSHYPYLIPQLKKLLPNTINIIDSGLAVANQTKSVLEQNNLLNTSPDNLSNDFYINKESTVLSDLIGNRYLILVQDF